MGRRLPWQTLPNTERSNRRLPVANAGSTAVTARSNTAESSIPREKIAATSTPKAIPSRKRAHSRTPSTSPPPGPPPVSPLREGYDNDDLYIMVEDEFYAVAQSYTAHLHHAEYKRLMRKAKDAPAKGIVNLSPSKPRSVRDRARRDALSKQQQSALDAMVSRIGEGDDDDDDDDDGDDDGVQNQENKAARQKHKSKDRRMGLAGLMEGSDQTKTSLVGLDRLPSSTRAAMGYGRGNTQATKTLHGDRTSPDIASFFPGPSTANQAFRARRQTNHYNDAMNMDKTVAVQDDEEDVWGREKKVTFNDKRESVAEHKIRASSKATTRQPNFSTQKGKAKRSFIDELEDDSDEYNAPVTRILSSPSRPRARPQARTVSLKQSSNNPAFKQVKQVGNQKKDKKDRLDEVPIFMF